MTDALAYALPGLALLLLLVLLLVVRSVRRTVPPVPAARPACPPSPPLPRLSVAVPVDDDAPVWRVVPSYPTSNEVRL